MIKKQLSSSEIRKLHNEYTFSTINYYKEPLVITEGRGVFVKDAEGREYLDLFGGILTVSLGHRNETVTEAIHDQVDRLHHVSTLYPTLPLVQLAENLARITPGKLKKCFFTASGTEANETAVMLAMCHTGNYELIALRHAYSGRSMLAQSLKGLCSWRNLPTQVAGIKHAHNPYCYRCSFGLAYPSCDLRCAKDIEELIQTTTTGRIAGFLAEPCQGVGGFIVPPKEYFKAAVEIVRKYGGVFICDEVQTGFGRTGKHMFGIEHFGVEPEIMTMAKGIANGLPLSATIAIPEVSSAIPRLTISTFGANPVSCAAANATIKVIEEQNIPARSEELGKFFREGLLELKEKYPVIGDVRGMGLMLGVEIVINEKAGDRRPNSEGVAKVFEKARELGALIGKGGLYGNVLRIAPPMLIEKSQINTALQILDRAFAS
jgi:4-aminobutyrate aminotransferase-like enzyme